MAESLDVRNAIAGLVQAAVYPNGTSHAPAIVGMTGGCAIFPSDLMPADIDKRLPLGDVLVGVMEFGDGKSTKRFFPVDKVVYEPPITLAWTVANSVATLSGTVTTPQNLAIILGAGTAEPSLDVEYAVQGTDTLASICTALGGLLAAAGVSNSVTGAAITINTSLTVTARVGTICNTLREVGRQMSRYIVSVWAQSEAVRTAAVRVIRANLDDQRRLLLADNTVAWMGAAYELPVYDPKKLGIERTNIVYGIEYPTVLPGSAAQAIVWRNAITPGNGTTITFGV